MINNLEAKEITLIKSRVDKHIKSKMTKEEFSQWKKDWFIRIPQCKDFSCVHELMSCGINILCGDCSIYGTYIGQSKPRECTTVSCIDCMKKYECQKLKK